VPDIDSVLEVDRNSSSSNSSNSGS